MQICVGNRVLTGLANKIVLGKIYLKDANVFDFGYFEMQLTILSNIHTVLSCCQSFYLWTKGEEDPILFTNLNVLETN